MNVEQQFEKFLAWFPEATVGDYISCFINPGACKSRPKLKVKREFVLEKIDGLQRDGISMLQIARYLNMPAPTFTYTLHTGDTETTTFNAIFQLVFNYNKSQIKNLIHGTKENSAGNVFGVADDASFRSSEQNYQRALLQSVNG